MKKRILKSIQGAICTRGANKGRLLSKAPKIGTDEAVVWNALMSRANPYKVSICSLFFMTPEQKEMYDMIVEATKNIDVRGLDKDRVVLETLNVW